jgi:hypothetical protein
MIAWNTKKVKLKTMHEAQRPGIDVGPDAHQPQQARRAEIADRAQHHRSQYHHEQRLARDMRDHLVVTRADILRDQGRAGERQARADGEGQEQHREADRDSGHRRTAQPPHPEGVDDLVGRLQHVRGHDRHGQRQQRAEDRTFEELVGGGWHAGPLAAQ